jgi:hypothetical protein
MGIHDTMWTAVSSMHDTEREFSLTVYRFKEASK